MGYVVYCHRNIKNGKRYIGITKNNPNKRWRNGKGYYTQYFSRAIKKYGWENFEHIILENNLTKEQACKAEKFYINKYDTTNPKNGYNETLGGDGGGMLNRHHTEEAKIKIGIARKNTPFTDEHRKHISESKQGTKHHLAKPVYQYSLDGKLVKKWDYMNDAAKSLNISRGTISSACCGHRKRAYGFIWTYIDRGDYYQDV